MVKYITSYEAIEVLFQGMDVIEIFQKFKVEEISASDAAEAAINVESAVRDDDTANSFSLSLNVEIPVNPNPISLKPGDSVVIGQYKAPEGSKEIKARWFLVFIK